ncbi:MAG: metallophosphoesterase family protein [Paludibacteraceae bacterium]|nr:metallophosphoesterase family protein [Paludibacteraceae bacterium]
MPLKLILAAPLALALLWVASVHLVWFFVWGLGKCFHSNLSYGPWKWTTIALVLVSWVVLAYGYFYGRFKLDVNHLVYSHDEVPASFEGYRIVHISDFHLSTFQDSPKQLKRFVDSINAQEPDLICFTGDLVSLGISEAEPCTEILQALKAKDGIASVLGNHDFFIYNRDLKSWGERNILVEQLASYQRDVLGWRLLRNENFAITRGEDTLSVMGVDNQSCKDQGFKTVAFGVLSKAMNETKGFRLLLSHDPSHWRAEVVGKEDIPLTLSGHTHDAQIKILGWSPSSLMFKEHAGLYVIGNQSLYVNVGLGCTFPIRVGANAEITVIELKCK